MAINTPMGGQIFALPQPNDTGWGPNTTGYLVAISAYCMQKTGGTFALTAPLNLGTLFPLQGTFQSPFANPAQSGIIQLDNADKVCWRNANNTADLFLNVNGSNQLTFNGVPISSGTTAFSTANTTSINLTLTAGTLTGTVAPLGIENSMIDTSAAIAYSKLNLGSSIKGSDINGSATIPVTTFAPLGANLAVFTTGSGFLTTGLTTATELGYVHGVTSSIQNQINSKLTNVTSGPSVVLGNSGITGGTYSELVIGANLAVTSGTLNTIGSGTVTSVAIHGSNGIGTSGSPITSSGTITLSLGSITPSAVNASGLITGGTVQNNGTQVLYAVSGALITTGADSGTVSLPSSLGTSNQQDIPFFQLGSGTSAGIVGQFVSTRNMAITTGVARANTPATSTSTYLIQHNGTNAGSAVWSASGTIGVVTIGTAISMSVNDLVSIVSPNVLDSTLANISITLVGTRF